MNIIVAVLILGVIIIIHELGHFLLAKRNGITVTEFSVGMGPRIASFVKNGTRYSLKMLPFGGSCMMLGEDEAVDDEGAFHKKPVWARFSVIFAGAFFNFILAFILALIIIGDVGVDKPYLLDVKKGSPADLAQMKTGDVIKEIDGTRIHFGREIDYYNYFTGLSERPIEVTYLRDGKETSITMTPVYTETYLLGINYDHNGNTAVITAIAEDYPLAQAGAVIGDVIVNINGTEIKTGQDLVKYLEAHPLTKEALTLTYSHEGEEKTVKLTPKLSRSGYELGWQYNLYRDKVSALEVIKYSFYEIKLNIVNTLKSVLYLISGRVSVNEVAGPVGIVNMVGDIVNESQSNGLRITILNLLNFSLMISANLGVMNLLPIPALDGGRLVFLLIEAVRRKPVPKEKEAVVHLVGMAVLMAFMIFVMFNDVRNLFR